LNLHLRFALTDDPLHPPIVAPLPDPWPEPVSGEELLHAIEDVFASYVFLPKGAGVALSLWTVHTYAFEAAEHFPILSAVSPEKRCGKTTLLRVLDGLVRRPLLASHYTTAVIARLMDKYRPTLLIDEADTFLHGNAGMTGILNAGHLRGGSIVHNAPVDNVWTPVMLSVWGPKSIAAIGTLPSTILDRSIAIHLHRKPAHVAAKKRWESHVKDDLEDLRRKLVRWTVDHSAELNASDPRMPASLNDRAQDNWRPLIAIADAVGGIWPDKARDAARVLTDADADDLTLSQMALEDFRTIIEQSPDRRIRTQDLVAKFREMTDRPWIEFQGRSRSITARDIATLLKPYGIEPKKIRFGEPFQGYEVDLNVQDMFDRYTPPTPELPEHPERGGDDT
jgi:hypothetical protein